MLGTLAPRVAQALIAACGDVFAHRLAWRWFGEDAAWNALTCHLLSWFTFYCSTRTFSNCAEAVLTAAALSYWPWCGGAGSHQLDPALKALGFQMLELFESKVLSKFWVSTANLHPYTVAGVPEGRTAGLRNRLSLKPEL